MLAIKRSHCICVCLNTERKEDSFWGVWWGGGSEKLPDQLDLWLGLKLVYLWSLEQYFAVCVDSHFLPSPQLPQSLRRPAPSAGERSPTERQQRREINGGKYCCGLTHFYLALNESALISLWSQFAAFGMARLHVQPGGISPPPGLPHKKTPFNSAPLLYLFFSRLCTRQCPLLREKELKTEENQSSWTCSRRHSNHCAFRRERSFTGRAEGMLDTVSASGDSKRDAQRSCRRRLVVR